MISKQYDIRFFVDAVKDEDYYQILCLTNREATEAGRMAIRSKDENRKNVEEYANDLKTMLSYLRYNVRQKKHDNMFGCILDRKHD